MFPRQQAAQHLAAFLHHAAKDEAVGPGEINMLENAVLQRLFRREAQRFNSCSGDPQHLAGFDVADIGGADQIEGACFRSNDPAVAESPEGQRAETARVTQRVHLIAREHEQRIRALPLD